MSTMSSPRLLSPDSVSSYDYISARSHTESYGVRSASDGVSPASDMDEIVWSVSDLSLSSMSISGAFSQRSTGARSPSTFSDDYIVLSRARSPVLSHASASSSRVSSDVTRAIERELNAAISALSLSRTPPRDTAGAPAGPTRFSLRRAVGIPTAASPAPAAASSKKAKKQKAAEHVVGASARAAKKERKRLKNAQEKQVSIPEASLPSPPPSPSRGANNVPAAVAPSTSPASTSGLGERAIVDDVSEAGDSTVDVVTYRDATAYITTFLKNPTSKPGSKNLKLHQALIIELGLCPSALLPSLRNTVPFPSLPSLPHSLRAAKNLLKSQAFVNVRDYLAVREEGLEALRRVMHPNRGSLMREVRSGRRLPVKTIKDAGLNVLLVQCF